MKAGFGLKTKFVASFVLFTVLLLSSILLFFYLSSLDYIKSRAKRDADHYARILSEAIDTRIQHALLELNGLRLQLIPPLSRREVTGGSETEWQETLKNFIAGYPGKYAGIAVCDSRKKMIYRIQPIRTLSGRIEYLLKSDRLSDAELRYLTDGNRGAPRQVRVTGPELALPEHPLKVALSLLANEGLFLTTSINFDYLIEQSAAEAKIPPGTKLFVTDSAGVILYAENAALLNRNIQQAFLLPDLFSGKSRVEKQISARLQDDKFYQFTSLSALPVYVGIQRDLSRELQLLNRQLIKAIIFAGLIFLLAGIFGQIQLVRMTRSLAEVTRVSHLVAGGDFSQKIEIIRRDELGALIDAFNKMVDQLEESYGKLNRMNIELGNSIEELRHTRAELSRKEKLALIGETVSKISHEIQNKIGGISIWVQNLEAMADDDSRLYLEEIKQALNSFMMMLMNFKKFYREPRLDKTSLNIGQLVEELLSGFTPELTAKKIRVVKSYNKEGIRILADKVQFEEVMVNILLNAIYFSPSGGTIEITCSRIGEWHVIAISDEGPGVPEGQNEKIFQPFFTTKSSGSGLGLAISYNIVKAHGGRIYCQNRPGGGAGFVIEIPVA